MLKIHGLDLDKVSLSLSLSLSILYALYKVCKGMHRVSFNILMSWILHDDTGLCACGRTMTKRPHVLAGKHFHSSLRQRMSKEYFSL